MDRNEPPPRVTFWSFRKPRPDTLLRKPGKTFEAIITWFRVNPIGIFIVAAIVFFPVLLELVDRSSTRIVAAWEVLGMHLESGQAGIVGAPDAFPANKVNLGFGHAMEILHAESVSMREIDLPGSYLRGVDLSPSTKFTLRWPIAFRSADDDIDESKRWVTGFSLSDTLVELRMPFLKSRRADIRGANLSAVDLTFASMPDIRANGAEFIGAKLKRAAMSRAQLVRADLTRANLIEADLRRADLYRAVAEGARMTSADLSDADVSHAVLTGASMRHARLRGANFGHSDLRRSILSFVEAQDVDLTSADLRRADLRGAKFVRANLPHADLTGITAPGANFSDANLDSTKLIGADLRYALFAATSFVFSDLRRADLRDAVLSKAHLGGVDLKHADLTGARLSGADFSGADMTGVRVMQAQLDNACGNEETILDPPLTIPTC